jgi:hypothetical protein
MQKDGLVAKENQNQPQIQGQQTKKQKGRNCSEEQNKSKNNVDYEN